MQNTKCIILEFPTGRRLYFSRLEEQLLTGKPGREWTLDDFLNVQKEEEDMESFNIAAFGNKQYSAKAHSRNKRWVNEALFFDGKGRYARVWHPDCNGKVFIEFCREGTARSLYHNVQTKRISWRELFPSAKPRPYERRYLEEPAAEQTAPD